MNFGKTSAVIIVTVLLASALLAVSLDTAEGASSKGYGSSDSMSVEYHVAGTGDGVATITLTETPDVSTVTVRIGENDPVNTPVSNITVGMESPLEDGSYPILVTAAGKQIAGCILTVDTYYTVTVTAGVGGSVSAISETLPGTTVTLTATPYPGYRLSEWSCSDVTVTDNSFTMPAKDITVNAVFEKTPVYPVTATADGQVDSKDIEKAIESIGECREEGLEQNLIISGNGGSVSVPADSVKRLLDLGSEVTVKLPLGSVTVNSVTGLQAGDDLKVIIDSAEVPSGFTLSDNAVVADVSMMLGEKKVTSFESPITVSIQYALSAGQDPSELKVYHLSDDGKATDMNAVYDAESGAMVFTTDHLSVYAVATSVDEPDDGISYTLVIAGVFLILIIGIIISAVRWKFARSE